MYFSRVYLKFFDCHDLILFLWEGKDILDVIWTEMFASFTEIKSLLKISTNF